MDVVLKEEFIETQLGSSWDDWYDFFSYSRLRVVRPHSLSDVLMHAMASDGRVNFVSNLRNPNSYVQCGGVDDFASSFDVRYCDGVISWDCVVSIPSGSDVEGLEHYFASNLSVGSEEEYRPSFDFRVVNPDEWRTVPDRDSISHGALFVSRGWFSFRHVFDDLFVRKGVDFSLLLQPELDGVEERDASASEKGTVRCQENILKELEILLVNGWRIAPGGKHTLVIVGRAGNRDVRVDQTLIQKLARSISNYLNRKFDSTWTVILGCVPYGMDEGHNSEKRRLYVLGGPSIFDLTNEFSSILEDKHSQRNIDVRVTSVFSIDWRSWMNTCLKLDHPGIKVGFA